MAKLDVIVRVCRAKPYRFTTPNLLYGKSLTARYSEDECTRQQRTLIWRAERKVFCKTFLGINICLSRGKLSVVPV